MDHNVLWHKLGKYIAGDCTLQEREEVEAWINADPERTAFVESLEEIWKRSAADTEWDVDEGWHELSRKLAEKDKSALRLLKPSAKEGEPKKGKGIYKKRLFGRKRRLTGMRVAASIALLAIVLVYFFVQNRQVQQSSGHTPEMQEIVVKKGQRSLFKLSDGTQVWLNGGSVMKIPGRFASDKREVYLEGEAYFDVTPDPDRSFVIRTEHSVTRVLGTQFNLQAYPEKEVRIVVEEGKVAFGSRETGNKAFELVRNQMGILSGDNQTSVRPVKNLDFYTGWIKGQLMFKDTPIQQVVEKLERWYDIECVLADSSLKDRTVTGTFKEESMTEVLDIISLSVGMTYEKEDRLITFISKTTVQ